MGDDGALQRAFDELEKWQNQYQKLMLRRDGFLNTSDWKLVSKISRKDPYNENALSDDESLVDLIPSYSTSTAELYGNNKHFNTDFTEVSYSGNSRSSELHEDLCNMELSKNICVTNTYAKQGYVKREKTKHGKRPPAINPYLNFLKRLEEPENYRIKREQFQQEISELSSRVCNVPTYSKESKKISYDDIKPIVTDEETTLRLLFNKRKLHFNLSNIPFNNRHLNLPEHGCETFQPQLIPSNQLAAHFLDVKHQNKYGVAWYIDCKEWFKPRLKE